MFVKRSLAFYRFFVLTSVSIVISGCAIDYPHPDSVALQKPVEGESIIYFLRAPHDSGNLEIEANGKRLAILPPESYVALSLPPGNYQFRTKSGGLFSSEEVAALLEVSLGKNQRKFFHVSGRDEKKVALVGTFYVRGSGTFPLLGDKQVVINQTWKECTELDARGLMSISRQVKPE